MSPLAAPLPLVASALEAYLTGQASTTQQAAASAMAKNLMAEHMGLAKDHVGNAAPVVKGSSACRRISAEQAGRNVDIWPPPPTANANGSPAKGKASALPSGSNYASIQFTHSPLRGKAMPSNQPKPDYHQDSEGVESPAQAPTAAFGVRGGTTKDLLSLVDEALDDVRGSQMMAMAIKPTSDHHDEGDMTTFGEALIDQADQVSKLLLGLVRIRGLSSAIAKQARLLPASVSYDDLDPEQVNRWAPDLARLMAEAIRLHPEQASQVADIVAHLSSIEGAMGSSEEFDLIYVESGLLAVLVSLLADPDSDTMALSRPSAETLKAQASAARALTALASPRPSSLSNTPTEDKGEEERQRKVFEGVSDHDEALTVLIHTVLDHSLAWQARLASSNLLASLLAAGGKPSERASKLGAFHALLDLMTKDMYPYMRQDSQGGKSTIVKALTTIAIDPDAMSMIAEHSKVGNQKGSSDAVLTLILKLLWGVIEQLVKLMSSSRHVDRTMIMPLLDTCRAASDGLNQIIASEPAAVDIVKSMRVSSRITPGFLQAIKDADLVNSLLSVKASVSNR